MPVTNPNLEGYYVTRAMWLQFYNASKGTFVAPKKCSGCYNDDRFVVWAVAVAVQAVVDGARIYPELLPLVEPAVDAFAKYKNKHVNGYSAAENGGTDMDIYYDDDAQVASAMITAYEVTGNKKFLDLGRELVRFLMGGWHNGIGGVKWHVSKTYVNACTTAEVAKACLQIAQFIPSEANVYIDFAAKCIDWQIKTLQDEGNKCIKDGIQPDTMEIENGQLSYNTGTTLSCAAHLYHVTKDKKWKEIADGLAGAAVSHDSPFFDRDYPNEKRYWNNPSFWTSLLAEGVADYLLYMGPDASEELVKRIHEEAERHLRMFIKYSKDPEDGLYIQSFEPHRTFKETYERYYKEEFGGKKDPGLRADDKEKDTDKPQKCLMGLGAGARVLFQLARVCPSLD
ncbi:putative meiotically up-regulated protein [Clavispora lusitaniae]|uniref:Meiotically up-regulated protein n=3 Tax=Clavispora lusitaniae TaxID=36911 RepID=C4Y2B1_CLAL4|nr:uncharacterized protein CLUG_02674 [Clavispora lusitaniae ATCC 42720]KAF5211236.1 hypothetical protein E0198_002535 [Clavispora lusitaniae]EEQ38548.1 hypothetical protein CLUG_02674 [Clavispora lusitaniae ATCC 42720]KAF7580059.1 Glycosyl hydrolase 76 family protein [Clavispora lusitaniae]OVF08712.1 hypothetical protein A9F13_07g01782 [Clavispora lusitaniae]QFZ27618.1 putative meiotically up-regulated protein [Clavispora lusitaniae]